MGTPAIGWINIYLLLPGCTSLKEKRSRLKPLLARLHKEFNCSTAEVDRQDQWQEAVISCASVSSDRIQTERLLQQIVPFIESRFPDIEVFDQKLELL